MHPHPGSCCALPSTTMGMGQHFLTPKKQRNKKKTQTCVVLLGQSAKWQCLLQHLNDLFNNKPSCKPPLSPSSVHLLEYGIVNPSSPVDDTTFLTDEPSHEDNNDFSVPGGNTVDQLSYSWSMVIPTITESYLHYLTVSIGKPLSAHDMSLCHCQGDCEPKHSTLLCLYFNHMSLTLACMQTLISSQGLCHIHTFPSRNSGLTLACLTSL